jgi:hypothetical protein
LAERFGILAYFGASCCTGARRAALTQQDDEQSLAEAQSGVESFDKLWKAPSMTPRKRRAQRSQYDGTISVSFGHAGSDMVRSQTLHHAHPRHPASKQAQPSSAPNLPVCMPMVSDWGQKSMSMPHRSCHA